MFMVDEAGATLVWWRGPIHPVPYCNILDGTDSLFTSQESGLLIKSTIATLASQTEFTLTGADNPVSNNDAYNEMTIIISGGGEADNGRVDDYTGSTGTVFLPAAFSFTIGVGDDVWILGDTLTEAIQTAADAIQAKTDDLTFSIANQLDGNMLSVSDDALAADNLESQYDTTGLTGDNFPATQVAVGSLTDGGVLVATTIATLANQVSFTLTAGSTDDNAYNRKIAVIIDVSTATQVAVGKVLDYAGGTKTVTLSFDPGVFTMAATDKIVILSSEF